MIISLDVIKWVHYEDFHYYYYISSYNLIFAISNLSWMFEIAVCSRSCSRTTYTFNLKKVNYTLKILLCVGFKFWNS